MAGQALDHSCSGPARVQLPPWSEAGGSWRTETVADRLAKPERKPVLLVVDDEEPIRKLFSLVLRQAGYEVYLAANGIEALAICARSLVDAVLLDLVMPEREGIETLRLLRRDYPGVRVAVVSGVCQASLLNAAGRLGAQLALPKPVRPAQLVEAVRGLLA